MKLNLLNQSLPQKNQDVEFDLIIQKVAKNLYLAQSYYDISKPLRFLSYQQIETSFNDLEIVINLVQSHQEGPIVTHLSELDTEIDFKVLISRISKESILFLEELNLIAKYIEAIASTRNLLSPLSNSEINLDQLHLLKKVFIFELRKLISSDGIIDYSKHPLLRDLYHKIQAIESGLRFQLKECMASDLYKNCLQYVGYDIHNDHFVLPIKSDSYRANHGRIIGHSDSGSTLYVEPNSIREIVSNRLFLLSQLDEIKNKICSLLTKQLQPHLNFINDCYHFAIRIDVLLAKAKFSIDSFLIRPEILSVPGIEIYGFFHPGLENPVANDIHLPENINGLIISGPNTGGKSVALKAITLCHLFVHFGLFVPASGAKIFPFDAIFYIGHDHENLEQGLSSFSSEVFDSLQMLKELGKNSLVVMDEIFSSTGSDEASALAIGLLEYLANLKSCFSLVSTHHQFLKIYMDQKPEFLSAHMGHDPITMLPTYKLFYGTPGSSMALLTFERLMQEQVEALPILETAKIVLTKDSVNYELILQQIIQKEGHLDHLLNENKKIKNEIENEKKAISGSFKLEQQKVFAQFEKQLQQILSEAENLKHQVNSQEKISKSSFYSNLKDIKNSAQSLSPNKEKNHGPQFIDVIPAEILSNHYYYNVKMKCTVKAIEKDPKSKKVKVAIGKMRLTVSLQDLRELIGFTPKKIKCEDSSINDLTPPKIEYDCRGLRLEEFQSLIELAISHLYSEQIPFINIIHGHGDGILKKWLRDFLNKQKDLNFEIPGYSADGSTKIFLINN